MYNNKSTLLPPIVLSLGTKNVSSALNWSYGRTYYYKLKAKYPNFHPGKNGGKRIGLNFCQRKLVHHAILFFINKKPVTILKDIREFVRRATGITRSISWFSRFMSANELSWKKVELKEVNKYTPLNFEK